MRVVRVPVNQAIETLANLFTLGKFNKAKADLDIDRYFHLFLEFAVRDANGDVEHILLEKNQKVDMRLGRPGGLGKGEEARLVNIGADRGLTLGEFLKRGEESVGPDRLWIYESTSNNCQRFVADLLDANGLSYDSSFVLQDVSTAVPNYLKKVMGFATNTANRLRTFLRGAGVY